MQTPKVRGQPESSELKALTAFLTWISTVSMLQCTAPVYAPMGGVDQVDFTKRGGRYTSDFIWNTKWKDQVRLPSMLCDADDHAIPSPTTEPASLPATHITVRRMASGVDACMPHVEQGCCSPPCAVRLSVCFAPQLDMEESRKHQRVEEEAAASSSAAGGLSLRRVADLNRFHSRNTMLPTCIRPAAGHPDSAVQSSANLCLL